VLWRIYADPNIRILVGCAIKELSTGFVREVKQYLENVELQYFVWNDRPHIKGYLIPDIDKVASNRSQARKHQKWVVDSSDEYLDPDSFGGDDQTEATDKKILWRANAIQVLRTEIFKEPTVYSCSVGTSVTGWHFDLIILDDIVTFENSDNPNKAQRILNWALDLESIVNAREADRGDEFIIIGTRYYKWDYYGHLLGLNLDTEEEISEYKETQADDPIYLFKRDIYGNGCTGKYELGMPEEEGRNAQDGYLCPKLMNMDKERKLRRRLTPNRFMSQYLNKIIETTDSTLNPDFINYYAPQALSRVVDNYWLFNTGQATTDNTFLSLNCCVDPAASVKRTADYSAIVVGGITEDNKLVIADIKYGHWTPSELANKIKETLEKWHLSRVSIEASGQQSAIIHTIKECWLRNSFNAYIINEYPKGDKKQRIMDSLEPYMESFYMPLFTYSMKEVRDEFLFFPSQNSRDDLLDAIEKVIRYGERVTAKRVERRKNRKKVGVSHVNKKYGGFR
jgi:predicted phage terminase large subunit-like protein